MAGEPEYGAYSPLFSALLLAMHRRPGLAGDLENLGSMLSGIAASVKGMQSSLEVFHNTVRNAAYGQKGTAAGPAPPADSGGEPGDNLKESVKNLETLFARLKNNQKGP